MFYKSIVKSIVKGKNKNLKKWQVNSLLTLLNAYLLYFPFFSPIL